MHRTKGHPLDVLQFAIAYEDGLKRQRTTGNPETSVSVKEEAVFAVTQNANNKEGWRCGTGNLTAAHLNNCKGPDTICNYSGIKGYFERCCNSKQKDHFGKNANSRQFDKSNQIGKRVQKVDLYQQDGNSEKDMMVLKVDGDEMCSAAPYYKDGTIKGNYFKTMINTGSPVMTFAFNEIKEIMKRKELQVRRMIPGEKYVDFNGKPLLLLGYVFCELRVGGKYIRKARILFAKKGVKSIIGREWLATLKYTLSQASGGESAVLVFEDEGEKDKLDEETKNFQKKSKLTFT